jgi:hypothetical protein
MDNDQWMIEYERKMREHREKMLQTPVEQRREFRARLRAELKPRYDDIICGCFGGKTSMDELEDVLDDEFGEDSR